MCTRQKNWHTPCPSWSFSFCWVNRPEFVQRVDRNVVNTVGKIKENKDSLRGTSNDVPSAVRGLGPSFRRKLPPCCHRDALNNAVLVTWHLLTRQQQHNSFFVSTNKYSTFLTKIRNHNGITTIKISYSWWSPQYVVNLWRPLQFPGRCALR